MIKTLDLENAIKDCQAILDTLSEREYAMEFLWAYNNVGFIEDRALLQACVNIMAAYSV